MKKRSNRAAYIIAFVLFMSGMSYLVFSGFSEARMPYLHVAELLSAQKGEINKAKVFGEVSASDLRRKPDGLGASFILLDKDDNDLFIAVDYIGVLPDLFDKGAEVIIEGRLENNLFHAYSLSTKCPSKYEKANREKNKV